MFSKLILLLTFVIGIFLGTLLLHIPFLELDPKINLISLANLILVIGLAVVIPHTITSSLETKRHEKNLLISDINLFCQSITNIEDSLNSLDGKTPSPNEFKFILSLFKKSRQHLEPITDQLGQVNKKQLSTAIASVDQALTNYWEAVTGNDGIKTNNFVVNQEFLWQQWLVFIGLTKEIKKLSYAINSY